MSSQPPRTVHVVAAVVVRGDRLMVTQRLSSAPRWPDRWEFPGGKVEPGESDPQALTRELREELDLRVRVGARIARVTLDRGADDPLDLRAYRCEILGGEPLPIEVQDIAWLPLDDVEALSMPPAEAPILVALRRDGL